MRRSVRPAARPRIVSSSNQPPTVRASHTRRTGASRTRKSSRVAPTSVGDGRNTIDQVMCVAPRRGVDEVRLRLQLRHRERLVATAVVGDHVADPEHLPVRVDVAQGSPTRRNEAFDPAWEIPPGTLLAELDDPGPDKVGRCQHGEGRVHDDIGCRDELVTRASLVPLLRGRPVVHAQTFPRMRSTAISMTTRVGLTRGCR